MSEMEQIFAADGILAERLAHYNPRSQQLSMAVSVENAIHNKQHAVIEAGTGTGKTFAYLVPALMSGKKVVISTATKTLQDQIFEKDLPTITKALGSPLKVSVLKGRRNYICKHRLDNQVALPSGLSTLEKKQLAHIAEWAVITHKGETTELKEVPETSPIWAQVTSTTDNCLGQACPVYDKCHVVKARKKAITSDIVVVNHHLLLADTRLKEEGFGELLPDADVVIVDEAHQIAELATSVFGTQWNLRRVQRWVKDAQLTALQTQQHVLTRKLDELLKLTRESRLGLQGLSGNMPWSDVPKGFASFLDELHECMSGLTETIKALSDDVEWEALWKRMGGMLAGLEIFTKPLDDKDTAHIRWLDVSHYGYTLHDTPIEISEEFKNLMKTYASSWIFTSATLAVGESFKGFSEPLGIDDAEFSLLDSSFNYQSQSMLMLPKGLPEPNHPNFAVAFTDLAEDLIEASGGGVFLLFTSYRMLNLVADRLRDRIDKDLLIQGQMPRGALLDAFREDGDAVLLGTSTFWEGVDVQGSALRCVVIDKLPFASPGDPVLSAKINAMRERGDNPFMQLQLPQAVISLKQGVGRLIRDEEDYGVLVLCDSRLRSKAYGKTFLKSLPTMPQTDSIEKVRSFYKFYDHG